MHGDVVGPVALDFILWLIPARMVCVSLEVNVARVHLSDRSADVPCLRIPGYVIADLEIPFDGIPPLIEVTVVPRAARLRSRPPCRRDDPLELNLLFQTV